MLDFAAGIEGELKETCHSRHGRIRDYLVCGVSLQGIRFTPRFNFRLNINVVTVNTAITQTGPTGGELQPVPATVDQVGKHGPVPDQLLRAALPTVQPGMDKPLALRVSGEGDPVGLVVLSVETSDNVRSGSGDEDQDGGGGDIVPDHQTPLGLIHLGEAVEGEDGLQAAEQGPDYTPLAGHHTPNRAPYTTRTITRIHSLLPSPASQSICNKIDYKTIVELYTIHTIYSYRFLHSALSD